jgi:hypothetical protein
MLIELTDQGILLRLTNTEDSTVERKVANDYRDCLKTAVAFSNSLPIDDPGIIFVGVFDDGRVQDNNNLDSLQKKVSEEINKIYPPIYSQQKVMKNKDGKDFLAVIVRGSPDRPHFAGPSYVRTGSETIVASEEQFARLIVERNSKTYEILKWFAKTVTFCVPSGPGFLGGNTHFRGGGRLPCRVVRCNQFFVTLEFGRDESKQDRSFPLEFIKVSFDDANSRLELIGMEH